MATVESPPQVFENVADLIERLGGVPPERVMVAPVALGRATEADVLDIQRRTGRLFELVEGTLVEKPMGLRESLLAMALGAILRAFVVPRDLGFVTGEAGAMRLFAGLVRIPDVAFTAWTTVPGRRVPDEPIPDLAPDLAVEILSASNTEKEMAIKRENYFKAGVRLVWIIDPSDRAARVFTGPDGGVGLDVSGALDGGDVIPGFVLPLRELFAELDHGEA
jgi:Uma2 family endonuclease